MASLFTRRFYDEGTLVSASAPATILPNQPVTVTMALDAADLADASLSIRMAIEANDDPSGNGPWYTLVGEVWKGGVPDFHNPGNFLPPKLRYASSAVTAKRVRGVLDVNKRIRASMDYVIG